MGDDPYGHRREAIERIAIAIEKQTEAIKEQTRTMKAIALYDNPASSVRVFDIQQYSDSSIEHLDEIIDVIKKREEEE